MRALIMGLVAALAFFSSAAAEDDSIQHRSVTDTVPVAANAHDASNFYPGLSRKLGEEGDVTLSFNIGVDGHVGTPHVVHSSGHPRLDAAAMAGVRGWLYKPATRGGKPCAVQHMVLVRFSLRDAAGASAQTSSSQPHGEGAQRRRTSGNPLWQLLAIPAVAAVSAVVFLPLLAAFLTFYLLPTLVAVHRAHPRTGRVFLLNLLLGWTILGWIGALVWAVRGSNPYPHFAAQRG